MNKYNMKLLISQSCTIFFTENVFHVTLAVTHDDTFLVDLDPADSLDLGKKF